MTEEEPAVDVRVVQLEVAGATEDTLACIRMLAAGQTMPTKYWRIETTDGRVLAEQTGGKVIIHRESCREVLGEEI